MTTTTSLELPQNKFSQKTHIQNDNESENNNSISHSLEFYKTYLGVSFAVFLTFLPKNSLTLVPTLESRNHYLIHRLRKAEDELSQLMSRRQEDSKANARVVEIFATHRNAWQQEERRLLRRLDESAEEISRLRSRLAEVEGHEDQLIGEVESLRREVGERDELLNFMTRHTNGGGGGGCVTGHDGEKFMTRHTKSDGVTGYDDEVGGGEGGESENGNSGSFGSVSGVEGVWGCRDGGGFGIGGGGGVGLMFGQLGSDYNDGLFDGTNYLPSGSRFWGESCQPNLWQDAQYESIEPTHHVKHFVVRRESPWKVDGESTGVPSKLKVLEEELLNLEKVGKSNSPKVVSSMRKQAKRYQDLATKIDELCRKMQASDPSEPTLSSEFRSQRQTEFLLEAFQLQQRASETGKKLMSLQTEIYTSFIGDELGAETKFAMRRSLDSIRTNFKEIQRSLEVWLARIMGDLEGILARDGASRARDYYYPRFPFVNN